MRQSATTQFKAVAIGVLWLSALGGVCLQAQDASFIAIKDHQ